VSFTPTVTGPIPFDSFDSPAVIQGRLLEIEKDLAVRQNEFERAAKEWYTAQRDIRKAYATAMLSSDAKSVTAQKAEAEIAAQAAPGSEHEAAYESLKAVIRVLEQRSMILMSVLRAQTHV
jgi:hypothetical protein